MRLFDQRPAEQNPLALVDLPVPQPAAGQLLLQVSACGVCHTDLHIVEGDLHPPRLPLTPGHQVVGRVVGMGETAFEQAKFQLGQRVGVPWLAWACGACEFCRRGRKTCARRRASPASISMAVLLTSCWSRSATLCRWRTKSAICRPRRCCAPALSATARCAWLICSPGSGWGWWASAPAPTWRSSLPATGAV